MRFLCAILSAAGVAHAQEICGPTPLYTPCDIVFELSAEEARDPQLQAEVKSPKFRTALVPAFHDGGRRYVIRFAPVDAGTYQFRLTSNIARFNGKTGTAEATPSDRPGFIRPANVHHWVYPDVLKGHLWTGAACVDCFKMPRAQFDALIAERAAQRVNHLRARLYISSEDGLPTEAAREVEARLRAMNEKGIIADLVLAENPAELAAQFPTWQNRDRLLKTITSRFAAFDVTWLIFREWESGKDGRPLAREIGELLKKYDPYNHPRSTGARATSAAMIADTWMDYINIGSAEDALPAVEHQFFPRPFVSAATLAGPEEQKRHRFWNLIMDGQYPSMDGVAGEQLKIWNELLSRTRFWELEPWFDVDGGRALALDDIEYLVYVEKPSGPIEVATVKHGYDVYWIDPANGQSTKAKDYRGEKFVGEPPDKSHDWLLHISRDGRKEGMLRSYKFESRQNLMQEIEQDHTKVPYEITAPQQDEISQSKPVSLALKIRRETRATRQMLFVWTGEVVADGQGYRVFCLSPSCTITPPPHLATKFPGVLNVRLSAINANGKAYSLDRVYRLVP